MHELLNTTFLIRPSSLTGWPDCQRRTAARLFPQLVAAAGFTLRRLEPHIGATVGTATHSGAGYSLKEKLNGRGLGQESDAIEVSMVSFKKEIVDGVTWDTTTRDRGAAEKQIARMVHVYRRDVAPKIEPIAVEERLKAKVADRFELSGQKDVLARMPKALEDLKTGKIRRANGVQYGAYCMIEKAHGRQVDHIFEDFIPRSAVSKEQAPAERLEYDVQACYAEAYETILDMKRAIEDFVERLVTGKRPPEGAFRANPMSMLCSDKYCPCWGTDFCKLHRRPKET